LPSGLSRALKDTFSGYVLFCGGSSTNSSSVLGEFHPADVFAMPHFQSKELLMLVKVGEICMVALRKLREFFAWPLSDLSGLILLPI